jgi:hypothetical protein
MSLPSKSTVAAVLAGMAVAAFVLWAEAGPAAAFAKPQMARFKVEVKGVQQMYLQHTHEAADPCDLDDYSSGSEKLEFKTRPIVITALHTPGLFNPEFIAKSAPEGLKATATVKRRYTYRLGGGTGEGCGENDGNGMSEELAPDCGLETVNPFYLKLDYSQHEKSLLTLAGGMNEDPYVECPGVGGMSFPELILENTNGSVVAADVSQDQLFDPEFGQWVALASGTKKVTEKDWWAKTTIHWDVRFTRLGSK